MVSADIRSGSANASANSSGGQAPLKILVVDDNPSDRMILQAIVKRQGHSVITAADGVEAIDKFSAECPDIVLLDAMMPRLDGFAAALEIKKLAGEDLIPIIFMTSLSDASSLAKCLEVGGDDFLSKPYNPIILQAKIKAFDRMLRMHRTMQAQRDQIAENNERLLQEQQVAKSVFDNVAHMGCLEAANIRHLLSPLSVFNGDLLLACLKPSGDMHVLLGDFTGHGLAAAIGAMPLAEIFYGMTAKGFAINNIISEINQKLKAVLPVGFFCCACLIELKFDLKEIEIWMGGLPDGYLLKGGTLEKVKSSHLPLGISKAESFDSSTCRFEMNPGDRFYIWSDGIIESENSAGERYGDQRLETLVNEHIRSPELFNRIKQDVLSFSGETGQTDDLTMAELAMVAKQDLGLDANGKVFTSNYEGPRHWELEYRLIDDSLASFDPIPLLLQIIVEVPGLRSCTGQIFTIISELYANALDHGILGLDSSLKSTPQGFGQYYQWREERCRQIRNAFVKVGITHQGNGTGGILKLRFEDSGAGFDYQATLARLVVAKGAGQSPSIAYSGRGLRLVNSLCSRMAIQEPGNIVEVDYKWTV